MKRILSLLLVALLLLSNISLLASCAHKCEFATEWSKGATSHWHACTGKDCTEVADKANHTWNDGEITTKATQEAAGIKTYTCTVCSATKTKDVAFTGMTLDEWNAAVTLQLFNNFTMDFTIVGSASGVEITSTMKYKIGDDKIYLSMSAGGQTQEEIYDEDVAEQKQEMAADLVAMFSHDKFTYDPEAKLYRAKGEMEIVIDQSTTDDATLRFENGKPVELKYSYDTVEDETTVHVVNTIIFSNYGTTVVTETKPQPQKLTKAEWNAAITTALFDNYTMEIASVSTSNGVVSSYTTKYMFGANKIYFSITSGGRTQEEIRDEDVAAQKQEMAAELVAMFNYDKFTYDEELGLYRANSWIEIVFDGVSTNNVALKIENGKPVEMAYTLRYVEDGAAVEVVNTVIFSDFGTTVVR